MKKNIQSVCKFVLEIRTSIVDRYLDSIEICPNQEWIEEKKHTQKKKRFLNGLFPVEGKRGARKREDIERWVSSRLRNKEKR